MKGRGWVVTLRTEVGNSGDVYPLIMMAGDRSNVLDIASANKTQFVLALDQETLGAPGAARYGKPWLRAEDIR